MKSERISFTKASNGIIVEIQHKTWDGTSTERIIFQGQDTEESLTLKKALNYAFELDL